MRHWQNRLMSKRYRNLSLLLGGTAAALTASALLVRRRVAEAERRHLPRGKFITVDGVRLHYVERGAGTPVVFLHSNGAMMDDLLISGVVDAASSHYRTVVFDRPGFGFSQRPKDRTWTAQEQANLFAKALSFLDLGQAIMVGHSWGTLVALGLALNSPGQVRGLVLASGYYFPTPRKDALLLSAPAIPMVGDVISHTVAPYVGDLTGWPLIAQMFAPQPIPKRFRREFPMELALRPNQIKSYSQEVALMVASAQQLCARYPTIGCPTVILAGDADRIVNFEKQAQQLHALIPGSRITVLQGIGHMLHHTDPLRIVRAIDLIAEGSLSRETVRSEASTWGTSGHEVRSPRDNHSMSEEALVPPDAVGWMVRVTRPPASEEFYLAAYEAKSEAEAAVRAHARVSSSNDVEGVATLSPSDLAEQRMQTGEVRHA